jgi:spore coat protein CotH
MEKIRIFFCICFAFIANLSLAQTAFYPSKGTVYDGKLHRIELFLHPDSLAALFDPANRWTDHCYPAVFVYDHTDTIQKVGLRLKGNTSRAAQKKGLRIDFDEFLPFTFQGLKKMNINGNHNDPSMCREYLSGYTMNQAYLPSVRGNVVQLYINGVYFGLRNNSEFVDKTFVQSRFGNSNGNLYKCSWPADLSWLGSSQKTYKDLMNGTDRAYHLKTNELADDYSDLVNLINVINNSPTDSFDARINRVFNVQAYLKTLAMEVLIGHWDNYFCNKNNYFLYHNTKTRKFEYLPYDMDNTFGVQWGYSNINNRNIHNWGNKAASAAPLVYKLFAITKYKRDFEFYIRDFLKDEYHTDSLYKELDRMKLLLDTSIAKDPFYNGSFSSDYGYDWNAWNSSFSQANGGHVSFGIKPFIADRSASALSQMLFVNLQKINAETFAIYPNPSDDILNIQLSKPAPQVSLNLKIFDETSRLTMSQNLVNAEDFTSISVKDLLPGVYVIHLEGHVPQKFMKR